MDPWQEWPGVKQGRLEMVWWCQVVGVNRRSVMGGSARFED